MKYKDRKDAKRKYKQALLATVAAMTLGVSTLGSTSSAFAEEKATKVQQAAFQSLGAGGATIAPKSDFWTVAISEFNEKSLTKFAGTGEKEFLTFGKKHDGNNLLRSLAIASTEFLPLGLGLFISPFISVFWPETPDGKLEALKSELINIMDQKIDATHLATLQTKFDTLQKNLVKLENSVNPNNSDAATVQADTRKSWLSPIFQKLDELIDIAKMETHDKLDLPLYTNLVITKHILVEFLRTQGTGPLFKYTEGDLSIFFETKKLTNEQEYLQHIQTTYEEGNKKIEENISKLNTLKKQRSNAKATTNIGGVFSPGTESQIEDLNKQIKIYEDMNLEQKKKDFYAQTWGNEALQSIVKGYGWKLQDGKRYYYDENKQMKTGWTDIDGQSYLFSSEDGFKNSSGDIFNKGQMVKGWIDTDDGHSYCFGSDGHMLTGPVNIESDGNSYFFSPKDGFKNSSGDIFNKGQMVTNWVQFDNEWYYFSTEDGFKSYTDSTKKTIQNTFNKGQMVRNFVDLGGRMFYFSPKNDTQNAEKESFKQGEMMVGWVNFGNDTWRYFSTYPTNTKSGWMYGQMVTGTETLHPHETKKTATGSLKNYHFDANGVWDGK